MMRRYTILLALAIATCLNAADDAYITSAEAMDHVGEVKTVVGVVVGGKYVSRSRGKPTFLNLDRAYPDHVFHAFFYNVVSPN